MKTISLVTGNPNKLKELQAIFPKDFTLQAVKLDLPEIQSLNLQEIVRHKLKAAFDMVKGPVIVEDVSAELECLNGLPGPFIKYFEEKLGSSALYVLSKDFNSKRVLIRCTMGYSNGTQEEIVEGVITGQIVSPRGKNGFGFDSVIIADGYKVTNAEMTPSQKNGISHRALAVKQLVGRLKDGV